MKKLLLIGLILIGFIVPTTALTVTAVNISENFIRWQWDAGNVTAINIDGKLITSFDPNGTSYILSNVGPNELHQITIYTNESNATASTYTKYGDNTWGWVFLVIFFFILGRYLYPLFFFAGAGISLYGLASWMQEFPAQAADVWHLPFLIFGFLFVMSFVLWYVTARKRR